MSDVNLPPDHQPATPIHPVVRGGWDAAQGRHGPAARAAAILAKFTGQAAETVCVPAEDGRVAGVLFGLGDSADKAAVWRGLPPRLPAGDYRIEGDLAADPVRVALAWAQGAYGFDRYRKGREGGPARLVTPKGADLDRVRLMAHACALARDMVNTPANDMGPLQMETIAREIAVHHGASLEVVTGEALIGAGYPTVHAVGRAADPVRAPRMIEIAWGDPAAPVVAVIGKGVVFDTGGLDIKPSAGMRLMKKDMGGGAHALALGRMIMGAGLAVRLHVIVPVLENAISGDAMRPGDVIASRKGLSIEIGNTDAEGRLILADALARAAELEPALTLDLATLTGAARVALGPEVVPFYTEDDSLAADLANASEAAEDPIWRMPLWRGYAPALDSDIADVKNDPEAWAQAGSITAALFLQRFAPPGPWAHFDIYAWNPRGRPGWPTGAEAQAILAILHMLEARFPGTGKTA
jgi:leucyl aminopeptidase